MANFKRKEQGATDKYMDVLLQDVIKNEDTSFHTLTWYT